MCGLLVQLLARSCNCWLGEANGGSASQLVARSCTEWERLVIWCKRWPRSNHAERQKRWACATNKTGKRTTTPKLRQRMTRRGGSDKQNEDSRTTAPTSRHNSQQNQNEKKTQGKRNNKEAEAAQAPKKTVPVRPFPVRWVVSWLRTSQPGNSTLNRGWEHQGGTRTGKRKSAAGEG